MCVCVRRGGGGGGGEKSKRPQYAPAQSQWMSVQLFDRLPCSPASSCISCQYWLGDSSCSAASAPITSAQLEGTWGGVLRSLHSGAELMQMPRLACW